MQTILMKCRFFRRISRLQFLIFLTLAGIFLLTGKQLKTQDRSNISYWIIPTQESSLATMAAMDSVPGDWMLLISSDTISEKETKCPFCVLSPSLGDVAQKWAIELAQDNVPDASVLTKVQRMTQVLYVVSRGAVGIILSSDIGTIETSLKRLILDNQPDGVKGIEYYDFDLTLDSFHFTHRNIVLPGNPCQYRIRKRMKPLWTVGVRCRKTEEVNTSLSFLIDQHAPPVFSPIPRFSILDFSDSFFDYEGIWAMFPAFLIRGSTAGVWGLWAQRLLQELQAEMALTSLPCPSGMTPHVSTGKPSTLSSVVYKKVTAWKCPRSKSFYKCGILLATLLETSGHVDSIDVHLLKFWFEKLTKFNHPEPKRKRIIPRIQDLLFGCVIHSPAKVLAPEIASKSAVPAATNLFPAIKPMCQQASNQPSVKNLFNPISLSRPSKVKDIALVVIFYDASIYNNIQFLEDLYQNYFPYLIYCGPDSSRFQFAYKSLGKPLSYIEVPDTKGFVAYECVSRAIMMNYDVNGYLEMADDVILNSWTLGSIPRDRFWFQKDLRIASRYQQVMNDFALDYPFPWWPWTVHGQIWGAKAMANVWRKFYKIRNSKNVGAKQIVNSFLDTLYMNSGKKENFFYCSSDIFYVPALHRQAWSMLSDIFFGNNVFLDIAVPTLMNGLDATVNILRMDGQYLWYNNRANYATYYRGDHQFFHPWKMGWIRQPDHAVFLCTRILPLIVTDLTDKNKDTNVGQAR